MARASSARRSRSAAGRVARVAQRHQLLGQPRQHQARIAHHREQHLAQRLGLARVQALRRRPVARQSERRQPLQRERRCRRRPVRRCRRPPPASEPPLREQRRAPAARARARCSSVSAPMISAASAGERQIGRRARAGALERGARAADGVANLRRAELTGFHALAGVAANGRPRAACRAVAALPLSYRLFLPGGGGAPGSAGYAWQDTASGLTSGAASRPRRASAAARRRPAPRQDGRACATRATVPGGAAVMVECLTDDRGRVRAEVRQAFAQHGGQPRRGRLGQLPVQHRGAHDLSAGHGRGAADAGGARGRRRGRRAERRHARSKCWPTRWSSRRCARCSTHRGFAPATAEVTQRAATSLELSGEAAERWCTCSRRSKSWTRYGTCIRMSRYRTRSWRAFDPAAAAAPVTAGRQRAHPRPRPGLAAHRLRRDRMPRPASCVVVAHGCLNVAARGARRARLRLIFEGLQAARVRSMRRRRWRWSACSSIATPTARSSSGRRAARRCAPVPAGVPVFEYAPRAIKLAVVGSGAAEKPQVAHMMRTLLALDGASGRGRGRCARRRGVPRARAPPGAAGAAGRAARGAHGDDRLAARPDRRQDARRN